MSRAIEAAGADVPIIRTGDWEVARRILAGAGPRVRRALEAAVAQEAHYMRRLIVEGMRTQAPGDQPFRPLSPNTLAIRRFKRFRGSKALIRRGDLRNAWTVRTMPGARAFVGIMRTARNRDGRPLANIEELNEYGSRPIVIPITPKMRRFLHAALGPGGPQPSGNGGGETGTGFLVVRIPARPVIAPIVEKHYKPADVRARFLARVGANLGGDFGQVGIPIPNVGGPRGEGSARGTGGSRPGSRSGRSFFGGRGSFGGLISRLSGWFRGGGRSGGPERDPRTGRFLPRR